MPTAWRRSWRRSARRRALQAAATWSTPPTTCSKPEEVIAQGVRRVATPALVAHTRKLVQMQRGAQRDGRASATPTARPQTERVRKMLLAFSRDLRVVLLRLASRLQTLRWYAASKHAVPARAGARVACRCSRRSPTGSASGRSSGSSRTWRSASSSRRLQARSRACSTRSAPSARRASSSCARGSSADLRGARHRGRGAGPAQAPLQHLEEDAAARALDFDAGVRRARAARDRARRRATATPRWRACTSAAAPIAGEFDDYIARPKANGYQSLHTVVRDDDGRAGRDPDPHAAMHEHAEYGVAAHWAYKEAGRKGYAGVVRRGSRRASPRRDRRCCASCWPGSATSSRRPAAADGRCSTTASTCFTPQAAVVELPPGATPVDFAYARAHRPRPPLPRRAGRRRDGAAEHAAGRTARRSRSSRRRRAGRRSTGSTPSSASCRAPRSRPRCAPGSTRRRRHETIARGREAVEKLLQREGTTALKLDDLAAQLGFAAPTRCSRWSARTSSRCATSRPCCARPSRRRRRRRVAAASRSRARRARPRAACWWSASIRC